MVELKNLNWTVALVGVAMCASIGDAMILHGAGALGRARFASSWGRNNNSSRRRTLVSRSSFFKDMLEQAFQNDENLSQADIREGQLEGPGDDFESRSRPAMTATQQKWQQQQINSPITTLERTTTMMNFFLTGIPNKDPSNDLFGSRVNISSRDRQIGLAVPETPTVSDVRIDFLPDNKCRCSSTSDFVSKNQEDGDWKISDDGKQVRFRIRVSGYTRTIQTKGTIQKIYWSSDDDETRVTSTTYSIPGGWLYGEADLTKNAKGEIRWSNGVLKVEQSMGLLNAGARMVPCGKFTATTASSTASS